MNYIVDTPKCSLALPAIAGYVSGAVLPRGDPAEAIAIVHGALVPTGFTIQAFRNLWFDAMAQQEMMDANSKNIIP